MLARGCVVRVYENGLRITVHDREDDDLLLAAFAGDARSAGTDACATCVRRRRRSFACGSRSTGRAACASRPAPGSTTTSSSSSRSTAASTSSSRERGDLETGPHHTAEDAAIALGEALDKALGDRRGIARYGDAVVPMDDALARAAVDLGGRRASEIDLQLDPGLAKHMLQSLADSGRMCIHVEATGEDPHHVAEAAFKAVGRSLRAALRPEGSLIPSTKGIL